MSANYASGLSPCESKGVCGLPELRDELDEVKQKVTTLAEWMKTSKHTVLLIGAGISTAAGIPDFRGPRGIWTLEKLEREAAKKKNKRPKLENTSQENVVSEPKTEVKTEDTTEENGLSTDSKISSTTSPSIAKEEQNTPPTAEDTNRSVTLADAKPTLTHLTIKSFVENNLVHFIISQNVDGLFLKTGIPRKFISEVHGNFFLDECNVCLKRYIRNSPSPTMALKVSPIPCPRKGRPCRGFLRDTILDWEDELPASELRAAEKNCLSSDLVICLGTTLQINPIGQMPFLCQKGRPEPRKVVIVNLQKTRFDKRADLVIHEDVNEVCKQLCLLLGVQPSLPHDFTFFPDGKVHPWE